ncbi:hypothetical protein ACLMJK_005497 [Lecanora helva]
MVPAHRKILFLTGAPLASSLGWTEADLCEIPRSFSERVASGHKAPVWRFLRLKNAHLPTGLTQDSNDVNRRTYESHGSSGASFITASDLSSVSVDLHSGYSQKFENSASETEDVLSQFYEHSFAVHDDLLSSQIINAGSFIEGSFNTNDDETSLTPSTSSYVDSQDQAVYSRLISGYLSDIKDIPNAAHLHSIIPQTMTVNLVVGIISISQPRAVTTRKNGTTIELVEMLVSDDTRSGFSINIWLPEPQQGKTTIQGVESLRQDTAQIRVQDIILAKNIALSSFRGKVHGQSLRKGMTTVDLLYRHTVDANDMPGAFRAKDLEQGAYTDPQVLKVKNVRDWVLQFVGGIPRPPARDKGNLAPFKRRALEALPADTP